MSRISEAIMFGMQVIPFPLRRQLVRSGLSLMRPLRGHVPNQTPEASSIGRRNDAVSSEREPILLRPLVPGDEAALLRFYRGLSEKAIAFYSLYLFLDLRQMHAVTAANRRGVQQDWVLLNAAAQIVGHGFLADSARPFPALGICIADAYQGQGLGRRMMDFIVEQARSAGRSGVRLIVVQENERALNLYQSLGFRITRKRRVLRIGDYCPGSYVGMCEMELRF